MQFIGKSKSDDAAAIVKATRAIAASLTRVRTQQWRRAMAFGNQFPARRSVSFKRSVFGAVEAGVIGHSPLASTLPSAPTVRLFNS